MDKEQFATWCMALRTYFPRENILLNKEAMRLWYDSLRDIHYDVLSAALQKWVQTNKWSPSIAEIREVAATVVNGETTPWSDAWETVQMAIRRYGYYSQKEAMESLDPLTRRCVENMGFVNLCMSERPDLDRANFRMIYETHQKREQERKQLALPLQKTIQALQLKGMDGQTLQIGEG